MRLVLRFMKPYRPLLALTMALVIVDVVGALLVLTLAARLLSEGTAAMSYHAMTVTALQMLAASLVAGCCASGACSVCSTASAPCCSRTSPACASCARSARNPSRRRAWTGRSANTPPRRSRRTVCSPTSTACPTCSSSSSIGCWLCGGRITAGAFRIGDIVAIIEHGTHDELLAKGGPYTKLYESQFA